MSEEKKIDVKNKEKADNIHDLSVRRKFQFPLFRDMNNMFDIMRGFEDLFWRPLRRSDVGLSETGEGSFRTPLSNVKERDVNFEITSEMPGLGKGDIEVAVRDGVLEIKGEVEEERKEEENGNVVRKEYRSSKYYRCFDLPENVDDKNIDATFEKGILKLSIPKKEPESVEKKKIEVK